MLLENKFVLAEFITDICTVIHNVLQAGLTFFFSEKYL